MGKSVGKFFLCLPYKDTWWSTSSMMSLKPKIHQKYVLGGGKVVMATWWTTPQLKKRAKTRTGWKWQRATTRTEWWWEIFFSVRLIEQEENDYIRMAWNRLPSIVFIHNQSQCCCSICSNTDPRSSSQAPSVQMNAAHRYIHAEWRTLDEG